MTTILVVDDDNELTELLDEFLSEHKLKTKVFHNPMKALDYLQTSIPDLILLDIMMPEMDGFQLLRKIQKVTLRLG